jgi:hypothetical protein
MQPPSSRAASASTVDRTGLRTVGQWLRLSLSSFPLLFPPYRQCCFNSDCRPAASYANCKPAGFVTPLLCLLSSSSHSLHCFDLFPRPSIFDLVDHRVPSITTSVILWTQLSLPHSLITTFGFCCDRLLARHYDNSPGSSNSIQPFF